MPTRVVTIDETVRIPNVTPLYISKHSSIFVSDQAPMSFSHLLKLTSIVPVLSRGTLNRCLLGRDGLNEPALVQLIAFEPLQHARQRLNFALLKRQVHLFGVPQLLLGAPFSFLFFWSFAT